MRLELTSRTNLALRALQLLSQSGERISRAKLADDLDTTPDFLARIMGPLVHRGWVASVTGPGGGYELLPSAGSATVYDLIDVIEGVPEEGRCVLRSGRCDAMERCALHDAWTRARKALTSELQSIFVIG